MPRALITGASKGIGKAIAIELAKKKYDLILVARSEKILQTISKEIATKYGVKADFKAIDLSEIGAATKLFDWCTAQKYQISMLVNNAGYGLSGKFESYDSTENFSMMQLNMITPVQLCQAFLPLLKTQPKAYIMNIASSTAYQAIPNMSLYAATKVFILRFSRGLKLELSSTNVSVTVVSPGSTDTEFVDRANINQKALKAAQKVNMTAEAVAKIAVAGTLAGKTEVITGLINKLGAFAAWLLPDSLMEKTAGGIYE